ncbi:PAS domain-containing sensor histidine kinase [Natrarchaeobaculum sulfurireducens]|uniref:histidine kinase n=1 Tax=Natrarchaeobaculum sulfurireducens TaxID=2044521 RepID=A0A346PH82_9EURY|nr:PAS domain-containing sensor histidine kinase [Natrarchaeobaculum sulfurireducens]AXR78877.1 Signal transduction histidine kinase [Natrarchaeobaculum sulfurireducens]
MTDTRTTCETAYERLADRISDPYCAVDSEWRITYWNERMAAVTDTRAADVVGDVLWDVVPALRGSRFESHCRVVMRTHEPRTVDVRLDDVSDDWLEATLYADEDGLSIITRDVTERTDREAEVELAETVFENTQDALFLIDVDEVRDEFRLERVNPVYEAHTGLSNDELSGRRLRDVFGDDRGGTILENYRECVARREPLEYEETASVPDEQSTWETRIAPVVIDGDVEKIVGATRNITELKERERRYDAIFNQTYQFTGLLDLDGTLLEANDSALEFGGFDRSDVVGTPLWESDWWRHSEDGQEDLKAAIESAGNGEFVRYDAEVQGADGTVIIDFSLRPITDERGEVDLLVAEGRDITAHIRRAQELEQKREFLGQIQSVAAIGGWAVDFRTEAMQWTDEVYRIHELPPEYEPAIEDGIEFYHPRDRTTITDAFERLQTTGDRYDLELRIVTSTDEVRWVRTLGSPWYDDDGDLIGARGAFQDITDRKEHERTLQRTNDRLEEFTAVVSHDLRNPLTVAQAALELARESGSSEDFDRIEAAHRRMNALITDLLALARNGQQVDETQPVALGTLVESVRETIPADDATIDVDLDGYRLEADEVRLRQLIENLLSNALNHGGDDVTVRVGLLTDGTGFYVADDGPGIPPAVRDAIFDQGFSTTTDGTGFGLAIVKGIAEAHGWTVDVTESVDGGARFEVETGRYRPE